MTLTSAQGRVYDPRPQQTPVERWQTTDQSRGGSNLRARRVGEEGEAGRRAPRNSRRPGNRRPPMPGEVSVNEKLKMAWAELFGSTWKKASLVPLTCLLPSGTRPDYTAPGPWPSGSRGPHSGQCIAAGRMSETSLPSTQQLLPAQWMQNIEGGGGGCLEAPEDTDPLALLHQESSSDCTQAKGPLSRFSKDSA